MKPLAYIAYLLTGFALCMPGAAAQDYPSRAVKILVPYAPGGQPDTAIRVLSQHFGALLGQPFIVENIAGSSGVAAINTLLKAPADGYTLLSADAGHWAINLALDPKHTYDPERDFTPIGLFGETTGLFLAVNDSVSVKSFQELATLARAKPGALSYASAGVGSIHHLIMEDLKSNLKMDILHVPYKGSAQAVPALVGGQVNMAIASLAVISGYVKEGRIKLLGVGNFRRSGLAPDVPTMAEAAGIPDFGHTGGSGLFARAGTPRPALDKIVAALAKVALQPEVLARYATVGLEASPNLTPEYLSNRIRHDRIKYTRIVKAFTTTTQ
ncbi:MAG: Bug family tripartite tricarboxylate transporter substrate binding protein [Burkholderiales bacterium]